MLYDQYCIEYIIRLDKYCNYIFIFSMYYNLFDKYSIVHNVQDINYSASDVCSNKRGLFVVDI